MITVGRSQLNADIKLSGKNVSRNQFILEFKNDNWYIIDGKDHNSSLNGTFIKPKEEIVISDHAIMEVRFGDYKIRGEVYHKYS